MRPPQDSRLRPAHLSRLIGLWLLSCAGASPVTTSQAGSLQSASPLQSPAAPRPPTPLASSPAPVSGPAPGEAQTSPREAESRPITDPPAAELARRFARSLSADPLAAETGLPARRDPNDNNPGSLVRSAKDLAGAALPFSLSHDKRQLAFTRRDTESSSIWIAAADGSAVRQVFDPKTDRVKLADGKVRILDSAAVFDVRFSRDDRTVFFQTDGWATSLALYRLDLRARSVAFVVDTNGYSIVEQCPERHGLEGSIVAYRHSYDMLLATALDVYFLIDVAGRDLGTLGPEPENVDRYLHNHCAPPPAQTVPPVIIPPRLKSMPPCGDGFLRYAPVHFLDGSELSVFYVVKPGHLYDKPLTLESIASPPIRLDSLMEAFGAICSP